MDRCDVQKRPAEASQSLLLFPNLIPVSSSPHLVNFCFIESCRLGTMQHKLSKRRLVALMVHHPMQTFHPRPRCHNLITSPTSTTDCVQTPSRSQNCRDSTTQPKNFLSVNFLWRTTRTCFIFLVSISLHPVLRLPLTNLTRYILSFTFNLVRSFVYL
jgi:hypothetical protein